MITPHEQREDGWRILGEAPDLPRWGESAPEGAKVLATIVHLSDVHLCDAESPARLEYLDHLSDPGEPYADIFTEIGTYRPQEILTAQVATAMVESVNGVTTGPVGGAPVDAVLVTGDVIDNAQANELDWYETIFTGGEVSPRSGGAQSSWVGSPTAGFWSDRFWHPEGPHAGHGPDRLSQDLGYPELPGLSEAARVSLRSEGIQHEWLTVHGNHDALLQGTVAPNEHTRRLALGGDRVVGLAPGQMAYVALESASQVGPGRYADREDSPTASVPSDPARRLLAPGEIAGRFVPMAGRGYWSKDVGELRVIALDTVNEHGGWQGSIDEPQLDWLRGELAAADRPVVITSHHPSWTMINPYTVPGAPRRVLAAELIETLLAEPKVVLWLAGHVHRHVVRLHPSAHGGLLEVVTASLIDWPQQGRIVEVLDDGEGGIYAAMTVLDHAGRWDDAGDPTEQLEDPLALAGLSRVLAVNDFRLRPYGQAGLDVAAGRVEFRSATWRVRRG